MNAVWGNIFKPLSVITQNILSVQKCTTNVYLYKIIFTKNKNVS